MGKKLARDEFLQNLSASGLFSPGEMIGVVEPLAGCEVDGEAVAQRLIAAGKLTPFQAEVIGDGHLSLLVIGNYLILDKLGAGGMGTVYKARHRRMKRVVALKILSRSVAQSEKFVQRFQREVEAVARLSHPNIVMAYDADEAEAGPFLAMEFVDGRDLATEVQQRGPLPVRDAVECVVQAARALDYAHGQGIIHRDIKPANLLWDRSGVVKVADLGLARIHETGQTSGEGAGSLTQAGTIMGTVDFMPPEQALGLMTIDHRADIYSLGCTLYFLLTGKPPYQGASLMATLLEHREGRIPSLREVRNEVPVALDQAFRRMVAKKPDERFSSMAEVVQALQSLPVVSDAQPIPMQTARPAAPFAPAATVEIRPASTNQMIDSLQPDKLDRAGGSILLVEPSRTQAVIIKGYLQKIGYQDVSTAPSGEKALELIRRDLPKVVISAMHLPDMTGVQLAQHMRADLDLSRTGFILITSQDDAHEANLYIHAGDPIRLHKPFDQDGLARALTAATSRSGSEAGSRGQEHLRVLLVDDSATARRHIREVLAELGLNQVTQTTNGLEALTLLGRESFDLVVTDYNMPDLDGRGLLEFIRQRSSLPTVPVIMVTTETDPVKLEAVRRLGVTAICDKAFRPEVVREILAKLR